MGTRSELVRVYAQMEAGRGGLSVPSSTSDFFEASGVELGNINER